MQIVLEYKEIMKALMEAVHSKTGGIFGEGSEESCFLVVIDADGDEVDVDSVKFVGVITND